MLKIFSLHEIDTYAIILSCAKGFLGYLSHIVDNEEINILAMFSVTLDFHLVFPTDSKLKGN